MLQKRWIGGAIAVALISYASLYYLVFYVWTDPWIVMAWPQPFFLLLLFLALGSTVIPVAAYLNQRFARPDWLEHDNLRLLRQGGWVGLWAVVLAYLQLIRALNWTIALVLTGVLVLVEAFFITRE